LAKKPIKIKRYHGYLGQRRNPAVTFLLMLVWAVMVATLVLIGIAIYEPVMEYIAQRGEGNPQGESSLPSEESSSETSSEPSSSQPEEQEPEPEEQQTRRAVYLAHSVLSDPVKLDSFLENALKNGASAVVVDVNNANGAVMHLSSVKTAQEGLAISDAAVDLGAVAEAITAKGLRPVARVYAFEDHVASYSLRRMACYYQSENILWYDNDPSNGGLPWLNPYSQEARNYVLQLAVESAGIGFEEVILAGLQFPRGYQLQDIYFGADTATPKADLLETFASQVQEQLNNMDVEMSVMLRAMDVIEPNGFSYGDGNPLERFQCPVYIDFSLGNMVNLFSNQYVFGEVVLENNAEPSAVVKAATEALKPFLSAQTMENKGYRAVVGCDGQISVDTLRMETEVLTEAGMKDIFFHSEFSSYPAKADYSAGIKK